MTKKIFIVIIIIFLSALLIFIYVSIHENQEGGDGLISPQSFFRGVSRPLKPTEIPTPTIFPTPTPIILDLSSGLGKEVEKLTPEDFSSDFATLKKSF